jgi:hypothetical protein
MKTISKIISSAAIAGALAVSSVAVAETPAAAKPEVSTVTFVVQSRDGYNRRVRIHNQTGWTMTHFYASDSRVSSWQEDILGSSVLPAGRSIMMNIDDGSGACVYDFRARFSNGQYLERFQINVCQVADYYYTR